MSKPEREVICVDKQTYDQLVEALSAAQRDFCEENCHGDLHWEECEDMSAALSRARGDSPMEERG